MLFIVLRLIYFLHPLCFICYKFEQVTTLSSQLSGSLLQPPLFLIHPVPNSSNFVFSSIHSISSSLHILYSSLMVFISLPLEAEPPPDGPHASLCIHSLLKHLDSPL